MRNYLLLLVKITIFVSLLFTSYYLFVLKPGLEFPNKLLSAEKSLFLHHNNLLQNRLSYVELTRLEPNSANFSLEKSSLVSTFQKTNQEGIELVSREDRIPEIDKELDKRFPTLLSETKTIYEDQNKLLEKVFATGSYEEGVTILKSEESINLLTRQTNLILEYEFWLDKMNQKQKSLRLP